MQGSRAFGRGSADAPRRTLRTRGYYGYIWSEVLDAATVDWFAEQAELDGGLRAAGEQFRRSILEPGGSRDAMSLVSDLLGGPAPIEPLLKRRGLQ
ncbi:M3 family metallopeptidase [Pseudoclavibacter sp. AY1F1]|uniref:M3 family metallopeptidase n=1 Tax=Pseudoclavibacter sp. AY1F1 TaxID=2080583 RepID=UPI0021571A58|nr:M3 family metallopeptidase [Pseudoclavibacter sp. AY1F1]